MTSTHELPCIVMTQPVHDEATVKVAVRSVSLPVG
jgi:hypothetical protein